MASLAGSVASLASGADWDPDRVLRGWLGSLSVPVWASEKDAVDCSHCHAKFETSLLLRSLESHKHNCRLCGQVFCSRCTSKYHLPSEWDPKGKTGAMRVCYSCAERVLQRKRDLTRNENSTLLVPSMAGESLSAITIHPPQWESKESAGACWKCHVVNKKGRSHNCRTCGRVACSDCSVKMDVPPAFKKKNKPGDARVCDFCRYLKEGGCSFSDSKAPERPPLVAKKSSAAADALSVLSPRSKTALINAIKPAEAPQAQAKAEEDSDDDDDGVQYAPREVSVAAPSPESPRRPDLRVFWEGLDSPIATMPPTAYNQDTSIVQIHAALVFQKPAMKDKQFTYVFRKKPVFPEHWDIFTVKFLGESIYIRSEEKETVEMPLHPLVSVVAEAATEIQSALTARALFEYNAQDATQLSFKKGDSFTLLDHSDAQWWYVLLQRTKARGWIPASFVEKSEFKASVEKPAAPAVPVAAAVAAAPIIVTPATEEIIAPTPACELVTPAPAAVSVPTPAPPSTAGAHAAPSAPRVIAPPPGAKSSSGQRGSVLPPPPPAQQRSSLISGSAAVTVGTGGVDDLLKARAKMFARK